MARTVHQLDLIIAHAPRPCGRYGCNADAAFKLTTPHWRGPCTRLLCLRCLVKILAHETEGRQHAVTVR